MAAALEAVADAGWSLENLPPRLGLVVALQNGAVHYSGRFYGELLAQPTLPSPLIFPETVFNAPASHVAQCLRLEGMVTTLIGGSNIFHEGLLMAAQWLQEGLVDNCLVLAAEEVDWVSAEALGYYGPELVATEGAAALMLSRDECPGVRVPSGSTLVGHSQGGIQQAEVLSGLAQVLMDAHPEATDLVTAGCGALLVDRAESLAWEAFSAVRHNPGSLFGQGMGVAIGFQYVLATALARQGSTVLVSAPGAVSSGVACVASA
jgi:3-oxoacyl-(acyl-carrier-protein) synthase